MIVVGFYVEVLEPGTKNPFEWHFLYKSELFSYRNEPFKGVLRATFEVPVNLSNYNRFKHIESLQNGSQLQIFE